MDDRSRNRKDKKKYLPPNTALEDRVMCKGFKLQGAPCKRPADEEYDGYCWQHHNNPNQAAREAHARSGKAVTDRFRVPPRYLAAQLRMRDEGLTWRDIAREMDDEELARCDFRDHNGEFGSPGNNVPRGLVNACTSELLRRGRNTYRESYISAIEYFRAVMEDEEAEPAVRLKAAQYIWERVEGKVPDKVEVVESAPWQDALLEAVVTEDQMIARAKEALDKL